MNNSITVEATIHKDIALVWNYWNDATHIKKWMHATEDWECTDAVNNLHVGGHFLYTLASKDGTVSFDLPGTYTLVQEYEAIDYTLNDGRMVTVRFTPTDEGVHIVETFQMETINSEELQRAGWQAMLESFKVHAEQ